MIECGDNGIGISPELLPRIFDLFVQGHSGLDRRQGGLGLGLAVARTLVDLHGGTIEARSEGTGRGSVFTIRLPLAVEHQMAERPRDRQAAAVAPDRIGRVMVVDDNHDALEMLLEALKAAGVEAFGATTPSEALELAARFHPRVAVLDIGLPEMNGFDLARALRAQNGDAMLRLIALTGYGQEQDLAASRAAGFDAFFVKPIDLAMLFGALDAGQPTAPQRAKDQLPGTAAARN